MTNTTLRQEACALINNVTFYTAHLDSVMQVIQRELSKEDDGLFKELSAELKISLEALMDESFKFSIKHHEVISEIAASQKVNVQWQPLLNLALNTTK